MTHYFKKVTLLVSQQRPNTSQKIEDSLQELFLEDIQKSEDGTYFLQFGNGETGVSHANVTMTIPANTTITVQPNLLQFVYQLPDKTTATVTLKGTQPVPVTESPLFIDDKPYVHDYQDKQGKVTKIVIHLPQTHTDQQLYETAKALLHSILAEWQLLSLAKTRNGICTWMNRKIRYHKISTVLIPGESFYQLLAYEGKEPISIDLPTHLTILISNATIEFDFDGTSYVLVKAV